MAGLDASSGPFWAVVICSSFVVLLVLSFLSHTFCNSRRISLRDRVVAITGGSSGIGKSAAKQILAEGGRVALIARKEAMLKDARKELLESIEDKYVDAESRISIHIGDVADGKRMDAVMHEIGDAHDNKLDMIITSAGISDPAEFKDISEDNFRRVLSINVTGTRNSIYSALPYLQHSDAPRVVMISSMGGLWGIYGFSAYSASKFALLGLAQALQHELRPYNAYVTVACPADVDTPLFEEENKRKPELCKIISESSGLYTPEAVAACILRSAKHGDSMATSGADGLLLQVLAGGACAPRSVWQALVWFCLAPISRLVSYIVGFQFNHAIDKYYSKHTKHTFEAAGSTSKAQTSTDSGAAVSSEPMQLRRRASKA